MDPQISIITVWCFYPSHHREARAGEGGEGEEVRQRGFLQATDGLGTEGSGWSGCKRCQQGQGKTTFSHLPLTAWMSFLITLSFSPPLPLPMAILICLPFLLCFVPLLICLILTFGISAVLVIQENPEFDLHFEKVYRWVASSTAEKNSFISCIWKLNQRYLRKKVEFVNVSSQLLEGMTKACVFSSDPRCPLCLASMRLFFLACFQSPELNLKCLCKMWVDLGVA